MLAVSWRGALDAERSSASMIAPLDLVMFRNVFGFSYIFESFDHKQHKNEGK